MDTATAVLEQVASLQSNANQVIVPLVLWRYGLKDRWHVAMAGAVRQASGTWCAAAFTWPIAMPSRRLFIIETYDRTWPGQPSDQEVIGYFSAQHSQWILLLQDELESNGVARQFVEELARLCKGEPVCQPRSKPPRRR